MKLFLVVGAATVAFVSPAQAAVVIGGSAVGVNDSKTIYFDGYAGGPIISGLTSNLTLTLTSAVNGVFQFAYDLFNTSSAPISASRVSGFGFQETSNAALTSGGVNGTYGNFVLSPNQFPNSNLNLDACVSAGNAPTNCNGGGGGGALIGQHATGTLTLNAGNNVTDLNLDNFLVRYQSIECSQGATNCTGSAIGRETAPTALPEPGTWAMMLIGFGAIGLAMRRKQALGGNPRVRFA